MSLRTSLHTYLLANSTITSLVGTRIRYQQAHPDDRVSGTTLLSYIELFVDDDHEDQYSNGGVGVLFTEITFDCYSPSPTTLDSILAALKSRIESAKRTSLTDVYVLSSRWQMTTTGPRDIPRAGQNQLLYSASQHFALSYSNL